jgi:hypothetical protein
MMGYKDVVPHAKSLAGLASHWTAADDARVMGYGLSHWKVHVG